MKLSAYKELDSSKRAQTLSRIILIAGAHLVIIGGAFLVTKFGDKKAAHPDSPSVAGVWSSQSADATASSVDASSSSLFDSRASDLSGYNAGEGSREVLVASNAGSNGASPTARFAPRRPSSSGDASNGSGSASAPSSAPAGGSDGVLQPVRRQSDVLFPDRSNRAADPSLSRSIEYKVQNGDSLWGLSKRFKVTVSEITAENPGIKANAIRVGQTIMIPRSSEAPPVAVSTPAASAARTRSAPVNGTIYKVKPGDNLSRIASRQGLTVANLKVANGLASDVIRVGQELVIPATRKSSAALVSQQHRGPKVTVKAGDSLSEIAAVYNVSPTELMRLNNISDPSLIRIGQVILIPEKSTERPVVRPIDSRPTVREPARAAPARTQPLRTLDQLEPREEPSKPLPTLDEAFGEEDLEDQPLILIKE